ncbi:MAG: KilA-N domain-containing protein, partial [Verrucomicrobiota bacterium]
HATIEQLLVLANLEGMNAEFIHMGLPQPERLTRLNQIAIRQMLTLTASNALRQLDPPKGHKS